MLKEPFEKETEMYYTIKKWKEDFPGIVAGITTRTGGVSEDPFHSLNMGLHVGDDPKAVVSNREKVAMSLDKPIESWVCAEQTHGSRIQLVGQNEMGNGATSYNTSVKETDGLITDSKAVLLTMCYADCVPLYFLDHETKLIGLAHAGWKGTVLGIGPKMVDKFLEQGSDIQSLSVVIGPSICEKCYVVDDKVINKVKKILEDENNLPYNLKEEGQYHLDLKEVNKLLLIKSGLNSNQIYTSSFCSSCHNQFFSYRKDGGKTGRIMSYIGWKE